MEGSTLKNIIKTTTISLIASVSNTSRHVETHVLLSHVFFDTDVFVTRSATYSCGYGPIKTDNAHERFAPIVGKLSFRSAL